MDHLVQFAGQRGVHADEVFEGTGKGSPEWANTETVPFEKFAVLYEFVAHKTGDNALGLHIGELYNHAAMGVVGQLIVVSRTVREAITKACEYFNLISNVLRLNLEIKGDQFHLIFEMNTACREVFPVASGHFIISSMVFASLELQFLTGKRYGPLVVSIGREGENKVEYERVFKTRVAYRDDGNYLIFNKKVLDEPVIYADYELLIALENVARKRLMDQESGSSPFTEKLKVMIYSMLDPGLPSLEKIAQNLNMSPRSLQRKLQAERTSYLKVSEEVKKNLAIDYLKKDLSVKEVSYLMGYHEPSSFVHAFKKWFGKTPLNFKALL